MVSEGEKYETERLRLRQDYEDGKIELEAPSLILYEICNTIWKRRDIPRESIQTRGNRHRLLRPSYGTPSPQTYRRIVSNARAWSVTVYDLAYATMSQESKRPLITADDDLRKRLSKDSIPVMFMADYKAS